MIIRVWHRGKEGVCARGEDVKIESQNIISQGYGKTETRRQTCSKPPPSRHSHRRSLKTSEKMRKLQLNFSPSPTIALILLLLLLAVLCKADSPPRITVQPSDLVAIEGESTELNCDAEGSPEPIIEWYHNGQLIKTSSQSRTTMGGSIQFLDIRAGSSQQQQQQQAGSGGASLTGTIATGKSTSSDTGVYYCLARNSFGQAKSRNASLQVAYIKREFRAIPRDKLAPIGETATFDCLPQAWPEPKIQWRHNGRLIEPNEPPYLADGSAKYSINRIAQSSPTQALPLTGSEETSDFLAAGNNQRQIINNNNMKLDDKQFLDVYGSQLVIKEVDKNDEGNYSCIVETKGTHRLIERESPIAKLSAFVKPYFIESPESKSVQVGSQVKLRCRMGGDPEPVVSWRKENGHPFSEKTQIDPIDKTLILDQVSLVDQATYVCQGENPIGSATARAKVIVTSRPKFTIQPEDQEVEFGSRVKLKCAGEAIPHPLQFWYKEGHRQLMFPPDVAGSTNNDEQQQQQLAASLTAEWPQAAPLVARNPDTRNFGISTSDTSPSINKLFTMPITDFPSLSPVSSHQHLSNNNIFGNNYFNNRIYVDNQGSLNIINVTTSDTGYYACALISSVGSVMAKAKLTVKPSPNAYPLSNSSSDYHDPYDSLNRNNYISSTNKYDLLPPPVIKLGSANQTLPTNTSVTLLCEVVSQVAYKIQWFFDNQPLQEEPPRLLVLETGALTIYNLHTSDSGVYTCTVTAATEQNMPLANPFEPLDSTMLTTAPPVQQSTSHSTMLKVASPMNPNIQFYRMDTFKYPSSPGPAYQVSTNGNDAITIAWAPPTDSGSLPIKEYVVEHYDTSKEHDGWTVIYRIKGKESLLIDGLSQEGSHFFVIRAANGHGIGPSSPIAGPMRTVLGESRYQMEYIRRKNPTDAKKFDTSNIRSEVNVARDRLMTITTNLLRATPMSPTSIKLQWSTHLNNNQSGIASYDLPYGSYPMMNTPDINNYLEGYSIRYRPIGVGESFITKDPMSWGTFRDTPTSLPLVTSYLGDDEDDPRSLVRVSRDTGLNSFDYSQEFSEVKIVDHATEHYTINTLRPFTQYQFFVVPYYKDIDGVPSNILNSQTNEAKPAIAPPNLTIRSINNTAIRLLWFHVPAPYRNGIIRSYLAKINRNEISSSEHNALENFQMNPEVSDVLNLPLSSLSAFNLDANMKAQTDGTSSSQRYILIYDLTNLTYKSFYSIQIAAATSVGPGPWSEPMNFIMDPKILSQQKSSADGFEDVLSKSFLSSVPQSYGNPYLSSSRTKLYMIIIIPLIISTFIVIGFFIYRKNNSKVITWKKAISERFTNKFYVPSSVDPRATSSIQQNIYDHQRHLIYSGSPHIPQPLPAQALWANNGCLNSNSGTPSLSSNGRLLPISPAKTMSRRCEQVVLLNNGDNKDPRFLRSQFINQPQQQSPLIDHHSRTLNPTQHQPTQIVQHGGYYYSVINNMPEYEELSPYTRNNMQLITSAEIHQPQTSSKSDTNSHYV